MHCIGQKLTNTKCFHGGKEQVQRSINENQNVITERQEA